MRFLYFFLFFPITLFALSDEPHHTTAFIGKPGKTDLLFTFSTYATHQFWNKHKEKLPTFNDFRRKSLLFYGEYAVNNQLSLFFNDGYSWIHESLHGSTCGLEDPEIGCKYLLYGTEKKAFTVQAIGIFPAGYRRSSLRYARPAFQFSLLYSRNFCFLTGKGRCDLGLGYRRYYGFPSDQIKGFLALTYDVHSYLTFIGTALFDAGVFNGRTTYNKNNIVFNPNFRLFKLKFEGVLKLIPYTSISIGGFQHLWGQNVGAGGGFFCGVWIDF